MSRVLRAVAWAIAVAAVIDPGFDRSVAPPAIVGVRVATARPSAAADAVIQRLDEALRPRATVVRDVVTDGPWCAGVDLCLVVGDGTATVAGPPGQPVHVVSLAPPAAAQLIAADIPARHQAELHEARVAVAGGRAGEVVEIVAEDDGVEVGRVAHTRTGRAIDEGIRLPWWPRKAGVRLLTVRLGDTPTATSATAQADTAAAPLDVLVWEARPSWTGTFVRRALQADPRLAVRAASQVAPRRVVARGVAGRPRDSDLSAARAVVVTGATALDAAGAERLARLASAGGAVVIALDGRPPVTLQTLLPGSLAAERRALDPVALGDRLRSAELVSFNHLPGDVVLASWADAPRGEEAVVVERRSGRGAIVVSGALDAWRWRDDEGGFDRFWQDVVVRAARASLPPLAATWDPAASGPRLRVESREGAATGHWPPLTITATCGDSTTALDVVEGSLPGTWLAAPRGLVAGCTIAAAAGDAHVETAWPGKASLPPTPPAPDALATLASVSGGTQIDAGAAVEAVAALLAAQPPRPPVPMRWHPMRARWWFIPFVACLAVEWWRRRRHGRV